MIPQFIGSMAASIYIDHRQLTKTAKTSMDKMRKFAADMRVQGLSNILIGVGYAYPIIETIKQAASFEKQMRYVSTVTQESNQWMDKFSEGVKKTSKEFGQGTDVISKALYDILSSQIPTNKALEVLNVTMKSAAAGYTNAATAGQAIVSVLNSYNLSADEAADVSNWLFAVVDRGTVTYEELAQSIGMVASIAATSGVSLDELGAALIVMTNAGVKADHAVVAINNIIKEFLNPTQDAAEVARQYGIELNATTLETEGLYKMIKKLRSVPQEDISAIFPNIRGIKGVSAALQGFETYTKAMDWMTQRTGEADAAFKKMTENHPLYLILDQMAQAATEVGRAMGEVVAPQIIWVGGLFVKYSSYIATAIKHLKAFIWMIETGIVVMTLAGVVQMTLGTGLWLILGAVTSLSKAWKYANIVLGAGSTAIKGIISVMTTATARTTFWNAACLRLHATVINLKRALLHLKFAAVAVGSSIGKFLTILGAVGGGLAALVASGLAITFYAEHYANKQQKALEEGTADPGRDQGMIDAAHKRFKDAQIEEARAKREKDRVTKVAAVSAEVAGKRIEWDRKVEDLKIGLMERGFKKEIALIDAKYRHELDDVVHDDIIIGNIIKSRNLEVERLRLEASREVVRHIGDLYLERIEDQWAREEAIIHRKYDLELKEAEGNAKLIKALQIRQYEEMKNFRIRQEREVRDQSKSMQTKLASEIASTIKDRTQRQIAELDIEFKDMIESLNVDNPDIKAMAEAWYNMKKARILESGTPNLGLAKMAEKGSAEAYSTIVHSKDATIQASKETAKNTKETAKKVGDIHKLLAAQGKPIMLDLGL